MEYPWYEALTDSEQIRQGDFIRNCPILIPPADLNLGTDSDSIPYFNNITVRTLNTVVVSQSCDLENGKLENVLVCPVLTLTQWIASLPADQQTGSNRKRRIEDVRKGHLPAYHLLNKNEDDEPNDFYVVDFRNVYGVNFDFLKGFAKKLGNRYRLLPPYREHLSQAFARFFMRVGLPNDIKGVA